MGRAKAKLGRPPKEFSEAQIKRIDRLAEAQCKDTTIALAMDIPLETFRVHFRGLTERKRAQGKIKLLETQYDKATKGDTTMLIWTGKQHLEQSDKAAIEHGVSDDLATLLMEINGTRILPN